MKAEILCVGTEILLGDIVNTNAAFLARELAAMGILVYHQSVVGDNPGRLEAQLRRALEENDCVIMTGGLGPTYDDLTKETAAGLFGRKMAMHEESLRQIEAFFARRKRPMTENNKKQAMMPEGAIIFPNHNGTAPGLALEADGKIAILLPGPPREMERMFRESVAPYLAKFSDRVLVSETVHIFGVGESQVEHTLKEQMVSLTNPTLAPYAKEGEVLLRVTAAAKDETEAKALIAPVVEQICAIFPDNVYGVGVGNLQTALVQTLAAKNLTVATAESCTGGLISKRITEVSGASQVFDCGVCSYANQIKAGVLGVKEETLAQYGAVSEQTAMEMAQGVRALAGAEIGISTTGIAGPTGGTAEKPVGLVYVGISSQNGTRAVRLELGRGFTDEREYIRWLASSHALYLALREAEKL